MAFSRTDWICPTPLDITTFDKSVWGNTTSWLCRRLRASAASYQVFWPNLGLPFPTGRREPPAYGSLSAVRAVSLAVTAAWPLPNQYSY